MWEITSARADFLFDASNAILILGAVFVLVGTIGSIKMAGIRELFSNERISANEAVAAKAKEEAAKANERAAELRAKVGPRRVSRDVFLSRLSGAPKRTVVISHADDDPDSFFLANRILSLLEEAKWDAKYVGSTSATVKECGAQLGGVLVLSKQMTDEEQRDAQKPPAERSTSWMVLTDALHNSIGDDQVGFATCPFVDHDALQIVVSTRWIFFPAEKP